MFGQRSVGFKRPRMTWIKNGWEPLVDSMFGEILLYCIYVYISHYIYIFFFFCYVRVLIWPMTRECVFYFSPLINTSPALISIHPFTQRPHLNNYRLTIVIEKIISNRFFWWHIFFWHVFEFWKLPCAIVERIDLNCYFGSHFEPWPYFGRYNCFFFFYTNHNIVH